jgi:hypothetical protein
LWEHCKLAGRFAHAQGSLDVELPHRSEPFSADSLSWCPELAASIVEQQIKAAVAFKRSSDNRLSSCVFADIGAHPTAAWPDALNCLFQHFSAAPSDYYRCSALSKLNRCCKPEVRTTAGNDCHLAIEGSAPED